MSAWLERTLQRAVEAHQQGRLAQAAAGYEQVLEKAPRNPDALHLLGLVAYQNRDYGKAAQCIRDAIASFAQQPLFHFNLGKVLGDAGDKEGAAAAYRAALRLKPDYLEALGNLGNVLRELGRHQEAIDCFRTVLARRPQDAAALNHLGAAYSEAWDFAASAECFERALAIAPNHVKTLYNYALMLIKAGRTAQAEAMLEHLLAIAPDLAEVHVRLAGLALARQQSTRAEACVREALRLNPRLEEAWPLLGRLLIERGAPDAEIADAFGRAGSACTPDAWRVIDALRVPILLSDESEIDAVRERVRGKVDALLQEGVTLTDPWRQIGAFSLFHLAYHGRNDRALFERTAELFRRACPSLEYVAAHCGRPASVEGRRLRVGFVSAAFFRHTIGYLFEPLLAALDRERCEVFALFAPGPRDDLSARIAERCEHAIDVRYDLAQAREQIAALELDALCYLDVGNDLFTYLLAFARLAPLQFAAWGYPVTTGVPAIDVFLSSRDQECETGQDHYSERLVRLENPFYVYPRPQPAGRGASKADFGFEGVNLYLCPQALFKIAPQFDRVLADILRRDPRARIALPEGAFPEWRETLRRRFARELPDVADRIVFFERMGLDRFVDFLTTVDVMLDSMPYGGGLTTLQALAVGTPIVTMPGPLMSSRFTYSCYRRIGVEACIAGSVAEYAELAVRVATSPALRAQLQAEILAGSDALFDNFAVVSELQDWLIANCRSEGADATPYNP